MSGEGLMIRRTNCPARLKNISHTLMLSHIKVKNVDNYGRPLMSLANNKSQDNYFFQFSNYIIRCILCNLQTTWRTTNISCYSQPLKVEPFQWSLSSSGQTGNGMLPSGGYWCKIGSWGHFDRSILKFCHYGVFYQPHKKSSRVTSWPIRSNGYTNTDG